MKPSSLISSIALAAALFAPAVSGATTYTLSSHDGSGTASDFADLDHYYLYMWGINFTVPTNERIISAKLHFEKIADWTRETDILKVYLLDNPTLNTGTNKDIIAISDSQSLTSEMMRYKFNPATPNSITPRYRFESGQQIWSWSDPDVARNALDPATGATRTYYSTLSNVKDRYTFDYNFSGQQLELLDQYLISANNWTHQLGTTAVRYNFGLGLDPDCHYYNEGISLIIDTAPVPEPSTILLLGAGLLGAGIYSRRRCRK